MKKTIKISAFVLSLTLLITASVSVRAEEIPRSSVPQNATEESILITENLISGILDEVSQGLGYLEARSKANNLIYNAVLSGQAGGYGYGLISPIACNAIFEYKVDQKANHSLHGVLQKPLEIGSSAFILEDNGIRRTSTVLEYKQVCKASKTHGSNAQLSG